MEEGDRSRSSRLVWIDLETTGLHPDRDVILEIATIVTDKDLSLVATGPCLVVHQPGEILNAMDPWGKKQHEDSGLLQEVRQSTLSTSDAEAQTLAFLRKHGAAQSNPLCGNSICFDRRFLIRHMPQIDAYLNYRHVDVSSIKELVARWYPELSRSMSNEKASAHRALQDIQESITELRTYRQMIFREKLNGHAA
ncbi:oligoribonuclease [Candidatus Bipolaricaulota bacterium]|nr:oligoribonuclease [Candidatus Bipolaricaulota bacterium]